jgi:hypothetical protein
LCDVHIKTAIKLLANRRSNPFHPTLLIPTGVKVYFYMYFGVQIPSPALKNIS